MVELKIERIGLLEINSSLLRSLLTPTKDLLSQNMYTRKIKKGNMFQYTKIQTIIRFPSIKAEVKMHYTKNN